jgi:hypothetical protein
MKRLLTGTFALFYFAFTVMVVWSHTFPWLPDPPDGKLRTATVQTVHQPHAGQKRMVEHPFAVFLDRVTLSLPRSDSHTPQVQHPDLADHGPNTSLSRAPPTLL